MSSGIRIVSEFSKSILMLRAVLLSLAVFALSSLAAPDEGRSLRNVHASTAEEAERRYREAEDKINENDKARSFADYLKEKINGMSTAHIVFAVASLLLLLCLIPCLCCCVLPGKLKCLIVLLAVGGCAGYYLVL